MAISQDTFSDFGGAVSDIFAGEGLRTKAQGDLAEGQAYDLAATLAFQNEQFTKESTAVQEMQQSRRSTMLIGGQQEAVAGAGFAESGSALDILRDSASQAALQRQVLQRQGLITEAGYEEQGKSYQLMSSAARMAASADETAAMGADISGAIKAVAGIASIALAPATGGLSLAAGAALTSASGAGVGGAAS